MHVEVCCLAFEKHRFGPKMVSEMIFIASKFKPPFPPPPWTAAAAGIAIMFGLLRLLQQLRVPWDIPPQIFLAAPLLEVRNPFKIFCVLALYTVCLYLHLICYHQVNDDANRTTRNLLILSINAFISEINYISHSPRWNLESALLAVTICTFSRPFSRFKYLIL